MNAILLLKGWGMNKNAIFAALFINFEPEWRNW